MTAARGIASRAGESSGSSFVDEAPLLWAMRGSRGRFGWDRRTGRYGSGPRCARSVVWAYPASVIHRRQPPGVAVRRPRYAGHGAGRSNKN
jgi:hypothetical protein